MPIELETISNVNFSEFVQKAEGFDGFVGKEAGCNILFIKKECPDQEEVIKKCGECKFARGDQTKMVAALEEKGLQLLYGPESPPDDQTKLVSGLKKDNQIVRLFHLDGSVSYRSETILTSK